MNKTNKNYLQAIIHNHACYCCIHHLHTRSKYLIIIILCKYSKCAYMYALLLVPFKIILENKSDSSQRRYTKKMEETNETQHYCVVMFHFELEYKNSLRTHED